MMIAGVSTPAKSTVGKDMQMSSNKLERTNDDIQFALSKFLQDIKDPRIQKGIVSITRVKTTGDLKYAKVWVSGLNIENEREFLKGLKSASGWLRKQLGASLNLRYTPELIFEIDHSIEYGDHINQIIKSFQDSSDED